MLPIPLLTKTTWTLYQGTRQRKLLRAMFLLVSCGLLLGIYVLANQAYLHLKREKFFIYNDLANNFATELQANLAAQKSKLSDSELIALIEARFTSTDFARRVRLSLRKGSKLVLFRDPFEEASALQSESLAGVPLLRVRLRPPYQEFHLQLSSVRIPSPGGATLAATFVALAIGIIPFALLAMYWLAMRQEQLARQRGLFVASMGHELKTPLTTVRMKADALRAGWVLNEAEKNRSLEIISAEVARLERFIDNVVYATKLGSERLSLNPEPVPVRELLELIEERAQPLFQTNQKLLKVECAPEAQECCALVDRDAFVRILLNLSDNILRYGDRKSSAASRLRISIDRKYLALELTNPVAPELPRSSKVQQQEAGCGIGLSFVGELVTRQKGAFRCEKKDRHYLTEFSFPITHARTT
jgi:signal transduction histidine kinase